MLLTKQRKSIFAQYDKLTRKVVVRIEAAGAEGSNLLGHLAVAWVAGTSLLELPVAEWVVEVDTGVA